MPRLALLLLLSCSVDSTVTKVGDTGKDLIDHATTRMCETGDQLIKTAKTELTAGMKEVTDHATTRFTQAGKDLIDHASTKSVESTNDILSAIKEWAVQIIVGILILTGGIFGKAHIEKRKRQRAEAECAVTKDALGSVVKAVDETAESPQIKAFVERVLKQKDPSIEYAARRAIREAKSK